MPVDTRVVTGDRLALLGRQIDSPEGDASCTLGARLDQQGIEGQQFGERVAPHRLHRRCSGRGEPFGIARLGQRQLDFSHRAGAVRDQSASAGGGGQPGGRVGSEHRDAVAAIRDPQRDP